METAVKQEIRPLPREHWELIRLQDGERVKVSRSYLFPGLHRMWETFDLSQLPADLSCLDDLKPPTIEGNDILATISRQ